MHTNQSQSGFTLIETLVSVTILAVITLSVYQTITNTLAIVKNSRAQIAAAALANEQFEIIRNLSYSNVGIVGGVPAGKMKHIATTTRDGYNFTSTTTIRNIDDPFDGTVGGSPNDLSPADYKYTYFEITCTNCRNFIPLTFSTWVGPRSLESSSTNGSLFVQVIDATGQPIPEANVHIDSVGLSPTITIDDVTNNSGMLQIVDTATGTNAYKITVSKAGYSTETTYKPNDPIVKNPTKPNPTIAKQTLTQVTLAIDKTATMNINTVSPTCSPVPNFQFNLQGAKYIGTVPYVYKYNQNLTTNGSGLLTLNNMEWDTYSFAATNTAMVISGTSPLLPVSLSPAATQNVTLIVVNKNYNDLMVTIKDSVTKLPVSGVNVQLSKAGFATTTLVTGRGFMTQTDWSGGAGQSGSFSNKTKFDTTDNNLEIANPAGDVKIKKISNSYPWPGYLISSMFDTGAASNFQQLSITPASQPVAVGTTSLQVQLATSNNSDETNWLFLGPNGSSSTYYTASNGNINAIHNGMRYLKYKLNLQTASSTQTPTASDISFTYTSSCLPPGQVLFEGLTSGTYTVTASKSGYTTATVSAAATSSWATKDIILGP